MSQAEPSALGYHRLTLENLPARSGSPATWGDLVDKWETYLEEKRSEYLVFVGDGQDNHNDIRTAPYSHRFQQQYTRMQYAKIQDFISGALEEYSDPHIVFLTFSTSTTDQTGDPRPPVDHLDELLATWGNGVYYELQRVMQGDRQSDSWDSRDYEYLYILEPTTNDGMVPGGYGHAHAALVVDGPVESARFESVITRHLTEAPNATGQAHEFEKSIEVKSADELNNPGAYMFKYLGKSWDMEEMEDYEKRFAGLLFEEERQRFRASNGAQRWMQRDEEESEAGEWIFAGVASERQQRALNGFDGLEDFRIAKGGGIRSWLQRKVVGDSGEHYRTPDADAEGSWSQPVACGPAPACQMPVAPSVGDRGPDGDRPPPA